MTRSDQQIPDKRTETYVAGDAVTFLVDITDNDGNEKSLADITDVEFVLAPYAGADPVLTKSLNDGVEITSVEDGTLRVTIDSGETRELGSVDGKEYHYEIELTDDQGHDITVIASEWTIHADTA